MKTLNLTLGKPLKMMAVIFCATVFLVGCGSTERIEVNEGQTSTDGIKEVESTSEVQEVAATEDEAIWGGMTEEELGLLRPENMPNCQVDENNIHYITYQGKKYYFANDYNRYENLKGSTEYLNYVNLWVHKEADGNQIVLGGDVAIAKMDEVIAAQPAINGEKMALEIGGPRQIWDAYDHIYTNIDVVDTNGNRFQLPNGVEWVYAEAHMGQLFTAYISDYRTVESPDEVELLEIGIKCNEGFERNSEGNAEHYEGILRFVDAGGYSYNIFIFPHNYQEELEYPLTSDTNFVNNITKNPVVLAESTFTAEEIFPDGFEGFVTDTLYYIENGGSYIAYAKSAGCHLGNPYCNTIDN